jgi:hypothetical protein
MVFDIPTFILIKLDDFNKQLSRRGEDAADRYKK